MPRSRTTAPAGASPLELMQSDRLAEVMDQLTEWFDRIVSRFTPCSVFGCDSATSYGGP